MLEEALRLCKTRYSSEDSDEQKVECLNTAASIYVKQNKKTLALMCLIGSLKLNPKQPVVLEQAEILGASHLLPIPSELKENKCTVSVIIPTVGRVPELKESIASVLRQSLQDFEVIVINDGGTESVEDVIANFGSNKIKYYRLKEKRGVSTARNEGILKSEGRYIAYLDDDDVYYENHLQSLVTVLEKNPNIDVAYTCAWWCYGDVEEGKFRPRSKRNYQRSFTRFNKNLLVTHNCIGPLLCLMHKKSCLLTSGIFNEELTMLEDWDLWLRLASHFQFYQINKLTGEYRWRLSNTSVIRKNEWAFFGDIVRTFYAYFNGKLVFVESLLQKSEHDHAEDFYKSIKTEYHNYLKYPEALKSLLTVALKIGDLGFARIVARDYFELAPRECLNDMIKLRYLRRAFDVCNILPVLPRTVAKVVGRKANYFFSNRI